MIKNDDRLYAIKPDEVYFSAGVTNKGEQVLMGLYCPNLIALRFDQNGNFLHIEERKVQFFQDKQPPYDIYDHRIEPMIEEWKNEIGLIPVTIKVKKFWLAEHMLGIEEYPSHFQDALSDSTIDVVEKSEIINSIELWKEQNQFVLWWGNDYWLDQTGSVISS